MLQTNRDGLLYPDQVRAKLPYTPQGGKITEAKNDWVFKILTIAWNESTLPDNQLPFLFSPVMKFQGSFDGVKLLCTTYDDGGAIQSPTKTDLLLYGGNDNVNTPLYAFRYQDYLRTGGGFTNLPASAPVNVLSKFNQLQFRVDRQFSALNGITTLANASQESQQSDQAATNAQHVYGIRLHAFLI